jgi:hypothetical protein
MGYLSLYALGWASRAQIDFRCWHFSDLTGPADDVGSSR